jgi:hypothetical protein
VGPALIAEVTRAASKEPFFSTSTFRRLLHVDRGKQQHGGTYCGAVESLNDVDVDAHLRGESTLAFPAVMFGLARFACIDLDEDFVQRSHVLRDAVGAIGGAPLLNASFLTNGSNESRGKLVISISEPFDATQVRAIILAIRDRAVGDSRFGKVSQGKMTVYPQSMSGGIVRVLGRNAGRDGPVEMAFSLYGECISLDDVIPLDVGSILTVAGSVGSSLMPLPWCRRRLEVPWDRKECGGNSGAFRRLIGVAREVIRMHGTTDAARDVFRTWLDRIARNSPDFERPSDTNNDPRNPLTWTRGGLGAWRIACAHPSTFKPRSTVALRSAEQRRLYAGIVDYVLSKGLNPALFGLDYERIREIGSIDDKRHAHRSVRSLAHQGFIDIVDGGSKRERGQHGLISLFALIGDGESVGSLRARREADSRFQALMERRAQMHVSHHYAVGRLKIEI